MIDLNSKHLETIQRILAEHVPKCEVRAFGSRVKWAAKDYSDLDLAIVGSEPLSRRQLRQLKEAFEESNLPIQIDAVDWQSLSDGFKKVIEAECKVIQKAESIKRSGQFGGIYGKEDTMFDFPNRWQLRSIEDSMKAIIDYRGKTPRKTLFGIPLITAKIVKGGRIMTPDEFIAPEDYDLWMRRGLPEPGDVVMTMEAPLGEVAQLDSRKIALAQRLITLRGKPDLINNTYLKFAMQSAFVQNQLKARSTGTTVLGIRQSELKKVEIPLPHLDEQNRIAHILGTLDDKIELNRQMNDTLEAIARAIFKSWFVDFDPVRAKMEGRMPAGMDAATATLFPSAFQDSPLGKIPKGWKVATVGEEFNLTMGQSPPGSTYNEVGDGLPFYQGRKDFGFRYPTRRVYCNAPTRVAKKDDTLVSVRAPVGDINMVEEKCCIGRGVAAIRHITGSRSYTYYAMQFLKEDFSLYEAEGTVFGAINKTGFQTLSQLRPSDGIIEAFERLVYPLDQSIENNENQSRTLSQIRDVLLPKLLSGEIRVDDVDKRLEVKDGGTS